MPSCPVHVSLLLPVLLYFLIEINGNGKNVQANSKLVDEFGINFPRWVSVSYLD